MKISRAIAVQSLTVCAGLILVAAVTVYSWGRYDKAQADAGLNSSTLQEFRLLEHATKGWLLNNDLIFASDQTLLIPNTRRQGELVVDKAENLSSTPLGRQAAMALAEMANLVRVNREELSKLQYVTPEILAADGADPLDAWDQRSMAMAESLELAGRQIDAAAELRAMLLIGERNSLIQLCVITYLCFGLLVVSLWRWLSRSLAKPLADLTDLAETALTSRQSLDLETAGPTEVKQLTRSINAFIQGREAQAFERAGELEEQKQMLESEVHKRIAAEEAAHGAAQQARAASKAKSQFLASMSHEIRTPLNGIIGSAEILTQDKSPEKISWGLDNIQRSSNHLLALVNDVLDFSKIEAGELELDPHAFLLEDLLMELRSIFATRARDEKLLFVYEIAPDIPLRIDADSLRIRQVLTNLLGNAFTYTESGYVVLRCRCGEERSDGQRVLTWEVEDSGIGIPPEKQEHIFDSFRQADTGTTRAYGGTGLGLAISKQLTELMGGSIAVESQPGKGSLFQCHMQVSIPADQPDPGQLPATHVLVAIDNQNAQRILGRLLESWDLSFEFLPVSEAAEHLPSTVDNDSDAVVIMDYRDLAANPDLIERARQNGLYRVIVGNIEDIDPAIARVGQREAILSYTMVPMELYSTLQAMYDPEIAHEATMAEPTRLSGRVLLAEDNIVNQQVTRAMLESLGLEVSIAGDGEIAVELMLREAPDLILMDWHMPNLDGVAATRRIRDIERNQRRKQTPIVMFTADTQKDNRDICMEAGVNDFLGKPVQMDALRNKLIAQL
ncbi:MAG: ATP-binding protein [Woeseiaceae bacterium]|nr:ATP-binding protein [Woeseiaceae bacterium]